MKNLFLTVSILLATTLTAQSELKGLEGKGVATALGTMTVYGSYLAGSAVYPTDSSYWVYYRNQGNVNLVEYDEFGLGYEDYNRMVDTVKLLLKGKKAANLTFTLLDGRLLSVNVFKQRMVMFSIKTESNNSRSTYFASKDFNKVFRKINQ